MLGSLNFSGLSLAMENFTANPAGSATTANHRRPADFLRRDGQIRPIPAARLAAGRDGRSNTGQRAHPCRDHGGSRCLHALPRFFPARPDAALHVIAYIGGFTALLAALIAIQQNDIKRILAYSTLSQLGYMVMAVGLSGPTPRCST